MVNNREGWDNDVSICDANNYCTGGVGPSKDGRSISAQGNGVYAEGVDADEDKNRVWNVCESAADVVLRFLTQVVFSNEELGVSWAKMICYVRAPLHVTSSSSCTERS